MEEFEGFIFDLDGTVANSLYVWKEVDRKFFERRNMKVPKGYEEKINAMSFEQAAVYTKKEFLLKENIDEIKREWFSDAIYEYANNVMFKEKAKEYIEHIKKQNFKTALCTASPKELYEPFLKNRNAESLFDVIVSGQEVDKNKSFPDIYLITAKRLNIPPSKCVVFEDISSAVLGAKKANMYTVGVFDEANKFDLEKLKKEADKFIFNFTEIY